MKRLYRLVKRVMDFCLSLCFLIISSPGLLLLGFLIWAADGWPVIFSAKRLGKDKNTFTVYKFRTLVNGVKRRKDGLSPKIVINRVAEYMRDTHLDETLQLVNVIKGNITLIGPRPLDVPRYHHLHSEDPKWDYIFKAKPGMTCINQIARYSNWGMDRVRKLNGLKNLKRRNRLKLDRYYIKNESPLLDLKVILWTIEYLFVGLFTKIFKKEEVSKSKK